MELTLQEQLLMGRRVALTKGYDTPFGYIERGKTGVICDFGAGSGEPCIRFKSGKQLIVPWDGVLLLID